MSALLAVPLRGVVAACVLLVAARHVFTAAPAAAAGWSGAPVLTGPPPPPYPPPPLMGAGDLGDLGEGGVASRTAASACVPAAASWPVAPFLPIMPQREQVNGGGPKAGEPVFCFFFFSPPFPGRAARHRHTPQWFLQHGSGPTPHGLAGWPAALCVCVCLKPVCVCVCRRRVWWLPALMQMLGVFKKWEPFLSSSVFPRWKGPARPSGAGTYFFCSPEGTQSQRDAPVIHFEIRHH